MTDFPFIVESVGNLFVLRDDQIQGGTKRRALTILLKDIPQTRIAYAGTILGHGALALAHACQDSGKVAEIFLSCTDQDTNPMVAKIRKTNAVLHIEDPLPISSLYERAEEWQKATNHSITLPPGFDMPEFETAMEKALSAFDSSPYSEIWTTCVSGALTRALQSCFPDKLFKTVKVTKSDNGTGAAKLFTAPEKYHQPAKSPPPYPACPYTDAKLWQFAKDRAESGALIWNTAGNFQ